MGPSLESSPNLLCGESVNSIMGWDDEVDFESAREGSHVSAGVILMNLPLCSDECIQEWLNKETDFLPRGDYISRFQRGVLDLSLRREAIDWIWKVHLHYNFNSLSVYLAVNYLDRFLSRYDLPQGKVWMMQLLGVACLSLAGKMEEADVPVAVELQAIEAKFVFEPRTIQRMEFLILGTLNWRMSPVTPFSFIDHFLHQINNDGNPPSPSAISSSIDLILNTMKGLKFIEFRPSVIAAAAAIVSVLEENQTMDFEKAISRFLLQVDKGSIKRCYEIMQETFLQGNPNRLGKEHSSISSIADSPNGVLDVSCLSSKGEEMANGEVYGRLPRDNPTAKKRRMEDIELKKELNKGSNI